MKNYACLTLGLLAFLGTASCGGTTTTAPADGGFADGESTGSDGAAAPDTGIDGGASPPDTGVADATMRAVDAADGEPSEGAAFAGATLVDGGGEDTSFADATLTDAGGSDETADATPLPDGAPDGDSSVAEDSAAYESDAAGIEGGTCNGFTTGNPTCDGCIAASCCTAEADCNTGGGSGDDNAGAMMCEQIVSCVEDACAGGGIFGECVIGCAPDEASPADALLTCMASSCSAQCM